jgi:hypothetical protein
MQAILWSPIKLVRRIVMRPARRAFGCCLVIVLALLLSCGLLTGALYWLVSAAAAQAEPPPAQQLLLLIDNSSSMYEKGGVGSDPELLRIQAAKLFISYLGVDSAGATHEVGVIFFGGEAQVAAPLTRLTDEEQRAGLTRLIEQPEQLTWTDPAAALALAATVLPPPAFTHQQAVILLTDGKPEWSTEPTDAEKREQIARLQTAAGHFASKGIPIFVVLLENSATIADPEIEATYVPLWQGMTAAVPPGHFYRASHSRELLDIYHDIVVVLTGRQSDGVVLQTRVDSPANYPIAVEAGLAQLSFVIRKSRPEIGVEIIAPSGTTISPDMATVQQGGQSEQSGEEVWAISHPEAGVWQIKLSGAGDVTVWKDFLPATATSTLTATPKHTLTPTAQPSTATADPSPTPTLPPANTPVPAIVPLPETTPSPTVLVSHGLASGKPTSLFWPVAWLCLPLVGLLVGGSAYAWRRYYQNRLRLSGFLRRLTSTPQGSSLLDLDRLDVPELALGSLLPSAGPPTGNRRAITLRAGHDPAGLAGVEVVVQDGAGELWLEINDRPLHRQQWLRDGDVLKLGDVRYRYENLRQRASRRRAGGGRPMI